METKQERGKTLEARKKHLSGSMINLCGMTLGWVMRNAPSLNDRSNPKAIHCGPARAVGVMGLPGRVPKNVIRLTTSRRGDDQAIAYLNTKRRDVTISGGP